MARTGKFRFDASKVFPNLSSAPIAEAVIHWRARAGVEIDPIALKEQLASALPGYPKCEAQRMFQFRAEVDPAGSKTQMGQDRLVGYRLTSADGLQIAQFTRDGLVFSRLKPYHNWTSFSEEGLRLWQMYSEIVRPLEVARLGVRFINQIPLNRPEAVSSMLRIPPKCLDSLGLSLAGFFHETKYDVPLHPYGINVTQTIQPPSPPDTSELQLILDIDVFTKEAFEVGGGILIGHLSNLRILKDEAFFSLLKPKALEAFTKE